MPARMNRALAVVEGSPTAKDLVREAGELAAGVGADLVLVHVTTEAEFDERREDLADIPRRETQYSVGQALEGARQFAVDVGREVLADVDVEWEAHGRLGDAADEIKAAAADFGCDHVFLTGRRRSPTGKAVFGDVAQEVILDFDGAVTVVTV